MTRLEVIGAMRLYVLDLKTRKPFEKVSCKKYIAGDTGFLRNMVVETGKEFILDEITNNSKWNSGAGISGVALGDSTNNIDGTVGPSEGVDIVVGTGWNDVVEDDWRLSSEIARSSVLSVTRTDQEVKITAQFVDTQFAAASPVKIREAGLFLDATTPPGDNPQNDPAEKPYAMVARRVYFGTSGGYYVDRPFYKVKDNNPLMYEYRLTLG